VAARAVDQPEFLHLLRRCRHPFAPHAQHAGNQFLRHADIVALHAIEAQQQPPAQALLQRVVPVARCGLRNLRDQRLGVAQQEVHQRASLLKLFFQRVCAHPERVPGPQHESATESRITAHEHGDADQTLVADDSRFGGRAVLELVNH
jgi:hypothetical protein